MVVLHKSFAAPAIFKKKKSILSLCGLCTFDERDIFFL